MTTSRPLHLCTVFAQRAFAHKYDFILKANFNECYVTSLSQHDLFNSKASIPNCDILLVEYDEQNQSLVGQISQIRRTHPTIPCVLMLARTPDFAQRQSLKKVQVDSIFINPAPQILQKRIRTLISEYTPLRSTSTTFHNPYRKELNKHLEQLCVDTGSCASMLVKSDGYYLYRGNMDEGVDLQSASALIAANVGAANQLVSLFGSRQRFNSNYHSNGVYGIYSCFVCENYLLALIFKDDSKLGTIRFYAHRKAEQIHPIVVEFDQLNQQQQASIDLPDLSGLINTEIDKLFGIEV